MINILEELDVRLGKGGCVKKVVIKESHRNGIGKIISRIKIEDEKVDHEKENDSLEARDVT